MSDSETQPENAGAGLGVPVPPLRVSERFENAVVEQAYRSAVQVLRNCSHPTGLKASARHYGHHQVWARDSMITLLGASLIDDATVRTALGASLRTLRRHQTATGAIPNNVDIETRRPNFRAYADGGLWYVIGSSILEPDYRCDSARPALVRVSGPGSDAASSACRNPPTGRTCSARAARGCISTASTRLRSGKLPNWPNAAAVAVRQRRTATALPSSATRSIAISGIAATDKRCDISHTPSARRIRSRIRLGVSAGSHRNAHPAKRRITICPMSSFRAIGEWFDTLGNLLAILSDVADDEQTEHILSFIRAHGLHTTPSRRCTRPCNRAIRIGATTTAS